MPSFASRGPVLGGGSLRLGADRAPTANRTAADPERKPGAPNRHARHRCSLRWHHQRPSLSSSPPSAAAAHTVTTTTLEITDLSVPGYERVVRGVDRSCGLHAII